jgi:anti-sigma factor ChrR (cupin superfamily)
MNWTELQELAVAHSLGALDPQDRARWEAAATAHPEAKTEFAQSSDAAAALALVSCPASQPPPELRAKILERIRGLPQAGPAEPPPAAPAGFRFVWNENPGWISTPIPGLRVKPLSVSRDMGYQVVLAELAPGTRFPEHDHDSSEELYILSGHLHTEGRVLGPGDFLHAEPASHHHELVSPDGCVALLINRAPVVA